MVLSTQASQLRLRQRPVDAGQWIVPEVMLQEADGAASVQEWADATDNFEVQCNRLTLVGGLVSLSYVARRSAVTEASTYRLAFTGGEFHIALPQAVGTLSIVSVSGEDTIWATYKAIGTSEDTIEVAQPSNKLWPVATDTDIVQFSGTWYI